MNAPTTYALEALADLDPKDIDIDRLTNTYLKSPIAAEILAPRMTADDCRKVWTNHSTEYDWETFPAAFKERLLSLTHKSPPGAIFFCRMLMWPAEDAARWFKTNNDGRALFFAAAVKTVQRVLYHSKIGIEVLGQEILCGPPTEDGKPAIEALLLHGSTYDELAAVYPQVKFSVEQLHAKIYEQSTVCGPQVSPEATQMLKDLTRIGQKIALIFVQQKVNKHTILSP